MVSKVSFGWWLHRLVRFEVGGDFGTLPLPLLAFGSSAADTPIRACRLILTAQCDLFRLGEAERGAVQSKATVRAALATIGPG